TTLDTSNAENEAATYATADPWDRQPGEPARWFHRFTRFCIAGPTRKVVAVWNQELAANNDERGAKGGKRAKSVSRGHRMPGCWSTACDRWRWRERAEAWDAEQVRRDRADLERARKAAVAKHCELGALAVDVSERKLRSRRFVRRIGPREVVALARA